MSNIWEKNALPDDGALAFAPPSPRVGRSGAKGIFLVFALAGVLVLWGTRRDPARGAASEGDVRHDNARADFDWNLVRPFL